MRAFSWNDSRTGRSVRFTAGEEGEVAAALGWAGFERYELLTTERALAEAPAAVAGGAAATHIVPPGQVPDTAAGLLDSVAGGELVALGGGRVVDTAKAIAAVNGGRVAAIPTTLSGAEMTGIHRLPTGHDGITGVRAALVVADPPLMTNAPADLLRASAMNALAHGADSLYTPLADELSRGAGLEGARLIAGALDQPDPRGSHELTLGALLCGHAVDQAGLAIQHVLSQTVVRVTGVPHAGAYAALLPRTMELMAGRAPAEIDRLAEAIGAAGAAQVPERIERLAGGRRSLAAMGAEPAQIPEIVEVATARPELFHMTPGLEPGAAAERDLAALVEAAM